MKFTIAVLLQDPAVVLLPSVSGGQIKEMLEYVQKLRQQGGLMKVRSAHTAGSIIRAYGAMGDIKGVWDTWNELRLHGEKEGTLPESCMPFRSG